MVNKLRDVHFKRVAVVDRGAAPGAHILLWKGETVPGLTREQVEDMKTEAEIYANGVVKDVAAQVELSKAEAQDIFESTALGRFDELKKAVTSRVQKTTTFDTDKWLENIPARREQNKRYVAPAVTKIENQHRIAKGQVKWEGIEKRAVEMFPDEVVGYNKEKAVAKYFDTPEGHAAYVRFRDETNPYPHEKTSAETIEKGGLERIQREYMAERPERARIAKRSVLENGGVVGTERQPVNSLGDRGAKGRGFLDDTSPLTPRKSTFSGSSLNRTKQTSDDDDTGVKQRDTEDSFPDSDDGIDRAANSAFPPGEYPNMSQPHRVSAYLATPEGKAHYARTYGVKAAMQ